MISALCTPGTVRESLKCLHALPHWCCCLSPTHPPTLSPFTRGQAVHRTLLLSLSPSIPAPVPHPASFCWSHAVTPCCLDHPSAPNSTNPPINSFFHHQTSRLISPRPPCSQVLFFLPSFPMLLPPSARCEGGRHREAAVPGVGEGAGVCCLHCGDRLASCRWWEGSEKKAFICRKNTWISLRDEISDVWPLKTVMSQQRSLKL